MAYLDRREIGFTIACEDEESETGE